MSRVLAGALVVAMLAAACGGTTPGPSSPDASPEAGASATASDAPSPTVVPDPKHELYGFVPYWEMDDGIAAHVATLDLTTLALFSVTHTRSGAISEDQNGIRRIRGPVGAALIEAARGQGTRVELVYTSFGEEKNRRFYTAPEAQDRWIGELVGLVETLGLDGVNVDVEGLPLDHVLDYGSFVGRLRDALRARLPEAQVSVATPAGPRGAAMAAAAAGAGADRIFLMGYDYHWEGSDPGATSPIDRLDGEPEDLVWSLDAYAALGVPVERTLLGLPLYGLTWPVIGPGIGSPATGRGDDWVPRRNLRVFEDPSFAPTYEPIESVEFYAVPASDDASEADPSEGASADASVAPIEEGGWNAVYYDSPRSLEPKLALADARGLAGAGFWAIGYERGLPGYGELMATFRAGELAQP